MRYTDPTGHVTCEGANWDDGPQCTSHKNYESSAIADYKKTFKDKYKWSVGNFSFKELHTLYETAQDIETYVDDLTGGKGLDWMNTYMGNISINSWNQDRGMGIPGNIFLPSWWNGEGDYAKYYFAHELSHIWDANTGQVSFNGIINGAADGLNLFINGYVVELNGCRFCDGSGYNYIPAEYIYHRGVMLDSNTNMPYGNNSTADYLSESFALNLYYASGSYVKSNVTQWINAFISVQASNLP